MDCEKYEPLLLDELYEELDEVTSAAVKRHVSGCARCSSELHGMRATRRLVSFPMVEAPVGLEDRILAAAREAQKVVPISRASRFSRVVSIAGRWAMRPQTAMAAVFLLMIGTTTFVIRSKHVRHSQDAVSVTEEGTPQPEPVAQMTDTASLNSPAAASAHGAAAPRVYTTPPPATATAATIVAANDPAADSKNAAGPMDRLTRGAARDGKDKDDESGGTLGNLALKEEQEGRKGEAKKTTAPAPTTAAKPSAPRAVGGVAADSPAPQAGQGYANYANADPISNAGAPGGTGGDYAPQAQAPAPPPPAQQRRASDPQDQFSSGMASYRTRSFGDAQKQFDSAASGGDQNAALWAARSVKEGTGCSAALSRFDAVATKSAGSWVGNEASLEAARCRIAMGQLDAARTRLTALSKTSSHAQQAQTAMNELNQVAARRGGATSGAAAAAPRAAPAPKAPAKSVDQSEKASGF